MVLFGDLPVWAVDALTFILSVAVFLLIGRLVVRPIVSRLVSRKNPPLASPLSRFAHYITAIIGILFGMNLAGYGQAFGAMGAVLAAATFALGFAMQDTLGAFISGIFLFIDKPFQIGDWIEWDGSEGEVVDIRLRTTKIETFDNELVTVPNDRIANATITNRTANDQLRITTTFGIGYDDDIEEAKHIILDILDSIGGIADEPAPSVRLRDLGDSTVDLRAFYWVRNPRRAGMARIHESVLAAVKDRFEEADIDMPYPTQTIAGDFLRSEPE